MSKPLRLGMVVGEASGDLLGSRVVSALRRDCDEVVIEGVGGPQLQAQGMRSLFEMERLSVMGLVDPLKRLPELLRIRRALYRHFRANPPDVFLTIDSPDFNLPLARKLRACQVPTAHLVSPSVWAWRRGRIKKIKASVDKMLCLYPFEEEVYRASEIPVRFVGHPLADEIPLQVDRVAAKSGLGLDPSSRLMAVLPGSRHSEIEALAPLFLDVAEQLWRQDKQLGLVFVAASSQREQELRQILQRYPSLPVQVVTGESHAVLAAADVALVAAGTATLEAALLGCSMVVAYRTGPLAWALLSRLVQTPYVALPNILAGRALVPEFLQEAASAEALAQALWLRLEAGSTAPAQRAEFDRIHRLLRQGCAAQVADSLLSLVTKGKK